MEEGWSAQDTSTAPWHFHKAFVEGLGVQQQGPTIRVPPHSQRIGQKDLARADPWIRAPAKSSRTKHAQLWAGTDRPVLLFIQLFAK